MSLLAIPEPATVDLDRARDLATAVMAWAEECDTVRLWHLADQGPEAA